MFPLSVGGFQHIFDVFLRKIFIWPCDLDLLTFNFGGDWRIKNSKRPMHLPILRCLRLSVPEYWVTQSYRINITSNGHCACAVSRDLSSEKIILISEIPDPNLPVHFVTFRDTTKFKPCYLRKITFTPLSRLQISVQYHVTFAQGVPQNHW